MELTSIKGIGEKTAGAFNRLGIFSAEDLIRHYPRGYDTFEKPVPLYELEPGRVFTVEGILSRDASLNRYNGMTVVNAYLSDMTGRLQLSWFNSPYLKNTLKQGSHYVFRGRVYEKNGRLIMNQPKVYDPLTYREKYLDRMMPVYTLTKGITNNTFMKAVAEALKVCEAKEYLPSWIIRENGLKELEETAVRIHFPRSRDELEAVMQRTVFDEFFINVLAGAKLSLDAGKQKSTHRCRPDLRLLGFMAQLPFELTGPQIRAYKEIVNDMSSGRIMNRLLEGDVGSGKTIVAVLAMLQTALNGYQAVIMAPTAVLAAQHYETFNRLLEINDAFDGRISTVLLTGAMTTAQKREAIRRIREHEADIIIGTHALFQKGIEYHDLGLIVTDEQHRFGVGQREALGSKGDRPHTLVMSATPIPRTLAMIMYSGMDISVIDARPSGRLPIKNCVVGPDCRNTAYRFIFDEIKKGRQAYIICPAIEKDSDEEYSGGRDEGAEEIVRTADPFGLENVVDYSERLRKLYNGKVRVGILHGRMKEEEKDSAMQSFKNRETDILVSTTVVEVGVDVPNASVIMIENAERFGLAELHQLRGRVGRGKWQSYCIMINTSDSERAAERLDILNRSNDGFKIAEEDLKLRGPGEIFGSRQSGESGGGFADIYADSKLLKAAGESTRRLLEEDPDLEREENSHLKRILESYLERGGCL